MGTASSWRLNSQKLPPFPLSAIPLPILLRQIIVGDAFQYLKDSVKEGSTFDYIFYDLSDVQVSPQHDRDLWNMVRDVLKDSMSLLPAGGKYMSHVSSRADRARPADCTQDSGGRNTCAVDCLTLDSDNLGSWHYIVWIRFMQVVVLSFFCGTYSSGAK